MTRILFWNIENFSQSKIDDPYSAETRVKSADRKHLICHMVLKVKPHIFVVAECFARHGEVGREGGAFNSEAPWLLLKGIRDHTREDWCLVPPLNLGLDRQQEGMAVYYLKSAVQFAGPYVWGDDYRTAGPRIGAKQSPPLKRGCPRDSSNRPADYIGPAAASGPQPYDGVWANCLPAGRNIPAGDPVVGNQPENRLAGQWEHYADDHSRINFPGEYNRGPWLTRFIDLSAGGNNRVLNLYAIHTSPKTARYAVKQLDKIPAVKDGPPAGSVNIIIGDFNVDSFTSFSAANGPYAALAVNHELLFDPRPGGPAGKSNPARQPFLLTHLLPCSRATPFSNPAPLTPCRNVAPRYGYMGSMGGRKFATPVDTAAIDNAFVRYPARIAAPAHNATVMNPVVGSPYVAPAGAAGAAAPIGTIRFVHSVSHQIPAAGVTDPDPAAKEPDRFREWVNFGKVRSTSDHLPIAIDV